MITMIEKYTNDFDKESYRGVKLDTPLADLEFHEVEGGMDSDTQHALHTNLGSLTVLDRMTGFGWRDIETGWRDQDGKFWLASGGHNVREAGCHDMEEAIEWVKERANTCVGA